MGITTGDTVNQAEEISGRDISSSLIDKVTAICFALAALLSVYYNFFVRKKPRYY